MTDRLTSLGTFINYLIDQLREMQSSMHILLIPEYSMQGVKLRVQFSADVAHTQFASPKRRCTSNLVLLLREMVLQVQ